MRNLKLFPKDFLIKDAVTKTTLHFYVYKQKLNPLMHNVPKWSGTL